MRPLPEYFAFVGGAVFFWVIHINKQNNFANFRRGSQMIVSDYTIVATDACYHAWYGIPRDVSARKGAVLKRFLVDL